MRQCVEEVEKRGIEEVGIYRISGVATDIQALKAVFDASESGSSTPLGGLRGGKQSHRGCRQARPGPTGNEVVSMHRPPLAFAEERRTVAWGQLGQSFLLHFPPLWLSSIRKLNRIRSQVTCLGFPR